MKFFFSDAKPDYYFFSLLLFFSFITDQYKTHTLTKTNVTSTRDGDVNLLDVKLTMTDSVVFFECFSI